MSAFAVLYQRSNTVSNPAVFNNVMEHLNHRGPDGSNVFSVGGTTMGHWHFWTTPEEVGEQQPLAMNGVPFLIVFDGRIDNREELLNSLHISREESPLISDAALTLRAYAGWGEICFKRFIGEFALVIFNKKKNELVCVRDHLGARTLFYSVHEDSVVIASEPWSVANSGLQKIELNESAIAHYFAFKATDNGQTFFNNVYELLPARVMTITPDSFRTFQYWEPAMQPIRYATDEEYAEHFRSLLEESVSSRMRATTPVGVLMSGGLDSTAIASLIAREIAPQRLTTISYVFDELSECDERAYIETVQEKWNTRPIYIPCDDAWPLKDWEHWVKNPNSPEGNPYRLMKERAYQRAHEEGLRVLFTGGFGDELYSGAENHILHLIFDGYFAEAVREINFQIQHKGMKKALLKYLRHSKRYTFVRLQKHWLKNPKVAVPAWLTPLAASYLVKTKPGINPRFEEFAYLFGLEAAQDCSLEIFNASRHSIELRHPFHDRRLIEFAINIPGYQVYRRGIYKHILRMAMKNVMPEAIRTCPVRISNFSPLYERGLKREQNLLQEVMQANSKTWSRFVSANWIEENGIAPTDGGARDLIPWMCASYERYQAYIN